MTYSGGGFGAPADFAFCPKCGRKLEAHGFVAPLWGAGLSSPRSSIRRSLQAPRLALSVSARVGFGHPTCLNPASPGKSARPLRGLVIVELKAPAPLCDPEDRQERALVSAVLRVIRGHGMRQQVMLTSFSPALLAIAARKDKEVARILSLSGLQFLTPEQVEEALDLPAGSDVPIDKRRNDLGLQWAEIGPIFRLPGYQSIDEFVATAMAVGARVIEADLAFFEPLGPTVGALVVDELRGFGLKVFGFTAGDETEWDFLESLGVDGIYTNDIPLGVARQAEIP